jgi:mannose-6-phosphate isomerase-like protein (cupin superfamily)
MAEHKAVLQVKDGIEFRGLGALVKRVIYPETTGVKGATLAVVYINPGEEIKLHSHPEEELYYIISGTGTVTLDDEEHPIGPGTAVYIAGNRVHGQRPTGNEPIVMVAVVTPPFKPGTQLNLVERPQQATGSSESAQY